MISDSLHKIIPFFSSHLIMVGTFPPPVTGMAVTNKAMKEILQGQGVHLAIIDISPKSLNRSFLSRLSKLPNVLSGLLSFFLKSSFKRKGGLYMGISGGLGQIYEIMFIIIARIFYWRIYIHHHSYAYLTKKKLLTSILMTLSGSNATHIVLCNEMKTSLKDTYGSYENIICISNIAFFNNDINILKKTNNISHIGFLGNISDEKGINIYLDLVASLQNSNTDLKFLIAGPFEDNDIKSQVLKRVNSLDSVSYEGSKYGREKISYLESIDVLIFPSQYINESEGIVILEALQYSCPVIATARGCIQNNINSGAGLVIDEKCDFVNLAKKQLLSWELNSQSFFVSKKSARRRFHELYNNNYLELDKLCVELANK